MLSIVEHDLGTPQRDSAKLVTLDIDGREVTVPEGTSVMRAAALSGDQDPEALRHRAARGVRLLPDVPGADRGHEGSARLLHDAGRRRA